MAVFIADGFFTGREMSAVTHLKDCINYLLTNAQHTVFQILKNDLKQFDITPVQYGVLKSIWEYDLHNPKDIADCLSLENSTISGVLDRMESKGLITREIDNDDRRFVKVCLTDRGRELEGSVIEVVDEVNRRVLSQFSDEEVRQIRDYLRKIDNESA